MRKGFGICCIVLGICCLLSALGLILYNRWEEAHARDVSAAMLQDVRERMEEPGDETAALAPDMPSAQIDGYDCIGVLSIPVLELELPVLTEWSYAKLKVAPCHYFGSCGEKDFVIAAHNYPSHFGRLSALQPKDLIVFTDITGTAYVYEVALLETLPADATEAMITSGFDLSLYTCTPGGGNRMTVRCSAVSP